MNPALPPLPPTSEKPAKKSPSPLQLALRIGFLLVSFLPAVWLLTHQKAEPKVIIIALIGAAMLCVICAAVMFRGVFRTRASYVLVSLALGACLFGVNLAVGLFLGCLHLLKDV